MSVQVLRKGKISGKRLYDLSEEEYRAYTRQSLAEARTQLHSSRSSPVVQLLVTLGLIALAGIVCLHHFGLITLER